MTRVLCVVAVVLASAVIAHAAAATIEEADAAFDAGAHDRALALYDEVLAGDADAVPALVRSAMLLSWSRRYDEALARYDRALALAPDHGQAALERAKVLSWAGRYEDAAAAFRGVLAARPDSRDARLGLARTLSWSGDQGSARAEYEALLAGTEAADSEAMVGVAQTWAWSGDLERARVWYERALALQPGSRDARLGLAYVDLWSGRRGEAGRRADELRSAFPADAEVGTLVAAVRDAGAPWLRTSSSRIDDTDDTTLRVLQLEAGTSIGRAELRGGVAWHDLDDPTPLLAGLGPGSVGSAFGAGEVRLARRQRLRARLGVDRLELPVLAGAPARDDVTEVVGGLASVTQLGTFELTLSADRDTFRYSPDILANRVMVESAGITLAGRPHERWRVLLGGGLADLSADPLDPALPSDNRRRSADAEAWYRLRARPAVVEAGYVLRWVDYRQDRDLGYFDPDGYTAHLLQARTHATLGARRVTLDAAIEAGVQSFRLGPRGAPTARVSGDEVLGGSVSMGVPLGRALVVEAFGSQTSYAVQSASGFRSRQLGLRLRWRFTGATP